jgi:hypothetical protein
MAVSWVNVMVVATEFRSENWMALTMVHLTDVVKERLLAIVMDVLMELPLVRLKVPVKELATDVGREAASGNGMGVSMVSPSGPRKVPMKVLVMGDESESQ